MLADLEERGLVHDSTDRAALAAHLAEGPATVYCGFDPTADSLHVGNLVGLLALRRFQLAGHRPVALAGGATGMIGDPSGRSSERNLLDDDTLAANLAAIKAQIARFLELEPGPNAARLVDNRDWTGDLRLIDFLRDVGKYVTVNQMVAKESVRSRMEGEAGISYTEFSYMLLQANDYAWLWEHLGCTIQVGGSDQWGNITAGIDLIRRRLGGTVHGLTWPLMTRADGAKFGKTAEGAVWLDGRRTSPFEFYQYWIQTDDRDVERFLLQLTLLPVADARDAAASHARAPERREGQRLLAREVTDLVHGPTQREAAEEATSIVFGRAGGAVPSAAALRALVDGVPTGRIPRRMLAAGAGVVEVLDAAGVVSSRSEARRLLDQQGVSVNNRRLGVDDVLGVGDLWHEGFLLVRRGRRRVHLVVATEEDGSDGG